MVVFCQLEVYATANQLSREVLPTVVRRRVWYRNLKNEEAIARVGPQRQKKITENLKYLIRPCYLCLKSVKFGLKFYV